MKPIIRYIAFSLLLSLTLPAAFAYQPSELVKAVNAAKEAPKNKVLNVKAGDALKDAGRYREAIPFYLKGDNSGNLGVAESYFYLYDFDKADEYLDKYLEKRTKAEETRDKDFSYGDATQLIDWTENLRNRIELGRSMLDRVEKIEIIDSINVPFDDFYKFLSIAKSVGRLGTETEIEDIVSSDNLKQIGVTGLWSPAYISEAGDDVIWYGSTDEGDSKMFESTRLTDGSWDKPIELFDYASIFGNTNGSWVSYPFLLSDGITLYFAADGENSLGDLDIFISRRDNDGFLQPSNIGMPYNSPYNDFMYVVDDVTGVGWWASDRNQIKDSVTIYSFIPNEVRVNYPVDTPKLTDYAMLKSVAETRNPDTDYTRIREKITALSNGSENSKDKTFSFALPGGRVVTSLSQLTSSMSVAAMKEYLSEKESYDKLKENLNNLRKAYARRDKTVSANILATEKTLEAKRKELKRLKNRVVKFETAR